VTGLCAADRIFAAFFNHERDKRPLTLQVFPGWVKPAGRDNFPCGVPQGVEKECALLANDVANLITREFPAPDHVEQRMMEPRVRVLGLFKQISRKLRRRKHSPSPSVLLEQR